MCWVLSVGFFVCFLLVFVFLQQGLYVCMYVCMVITYSKSMDQPGKVANPARGQLNRENKYFPVSVRVREFGLAETGLAVPSRVRLNLVHFTGFLPISAAASIYLLLYINSVVGQ